MVDLLPARNPGESDMELLAVPPSDSLAPVELILTGVFICLLIFMLVYTEQTKGNYASYDEPEVTEDFEE